MLHLRAEGYFWMICSSSVAYESYFSINRTHFDYINMILLKQRSKKVLSKHNKKLANKVKIKKFFDIILNARSKKAFA